MLHMLDRAVIHFFASGGITLVALIVLRFVQRKKNWPWLPLNFQGQLVFVAISIFAISALREAFDVAAGQSVAKAVSDYASWALGCGCSAWGLWRLFASLK